MWPWGHLAFGYLLYSPAVHLLKRRGPGSLAVIALALGTQLPDLVDKSLSWVFEITPGGYSVAHSVFVAVPLGLAVVTLAVDRDRAATGAAFVVGWWSHLVGDVLFGLALENPYAFDRVLWPVVVLPASASDTPALGRIVRYLVDWVGYLLATETFLVPALYLAPLAAAGLLWLIDGAPGLLRPERRR